MSDDKSIDNAKFQLLLRHGDSSLILGQRLSEWCGHAPELELDLAVSNLGLDLIGQASQWLEYAGEIEGKGRSADDLSFLRDVMEFRNYLLVEQPNGDWAETIARQYFFTVWQVAALDAMGGSNDDRVAAIARKAINEARYHLKFARDWMLRLGDGTKTSHARLQRAVDILWRFTGEMFLSEDFDNAISETGVAADPATLEDGWQREVSGLFDSIGIQIPETPMMITGAAVGHHTEHLGHILSELQFLQRAYPGAKW